MTEKQILSRIIQKHDIEANWNKAVNFVPMRGELIVYDIDDIHLYERFKIGDGVTNVNDLPFTVMQSDWNQNDESAVDFIKNRTHYRVPNENKILLDDTFTSYALDSYFVIKKPEGFALEPYVEYKVTINDVTYTNTALSNGYLYPSDDFTGGMPNSFGKYYIYVDAVGEYTIKVEDTREYLYTPIDSEYLPDGLRTGTGERSWTIGDTVNNKASGRYSFAQGCDTEASSLDAAAFGQYTVASGPYSFAEGYGSKASAYYSHAQGLYTVANGKIQHVQGKYNIEDTENKYAHIVGNGTSDTIRSNAHTLDWEGMGWFAGGLKVGGTGQDDESAVEVALKTDIPEIPVTSINGQTGDVVITIPEVPEQVQVDWEQSDENAVDFIKNKPDFNSLEAEIAQKSQVQIVTLDSEEFVPTLKIHKLTQEEYDQAITDGTIDENALYLTPDEEINLSGYATEEYVDNALATIPTPDVSGQIESHNTDLNAHEDIRSLIENLESPVSSVNGKTGTVVLTAEDVGALPSDTVIPSITGLATEEYANNAANAVKNDLLNGAGEAYDTLKELGDLIDDNQDAISALEIVATGKADKNHSHNDIYYSKTEVDSAVAQKSQVQIITWEADD